MPVGCYVRSPSVATRSRRPAIIYWRFSGHMEVEQRASLGITPRTAWHEQCAGCCMSFSAFWLLFSVYIRRSEMKKSDRVGNGPWDPTASALLRRRLGDFAQLRLLDDSAKDKRSTDEEEAAATTTERPALFTDVECANMPKMDTCKLLVTFRDKMSLADLESFAAKYSSVKIMKNLKIVTINFGSDKAKCCKTYSDLQTANNPNVEASEFDQPMQMTR